MREDSRRGAPRQARAGDKSAGRDSRGKANASRGTSGAGSRSGPAGPRPGAGTGRGGRAPADTARLTALIAPVLHAMDIDLESLKVANAGRRKVLRIIVDADGGVSLDDIAEVSREVSARLDAKDVMGEAPYTLEVSSPGVDRPLTQPRHWRRAIGRLVLVPVRTAQPDPRPPADEHGETAGTAELEARVVDADDERVILDAGGTRHTVGYSELGAGRVQVEFGRLPDLDDAGDAADLHDLGDFEGSWDGPDEEGPDGH